MSIRTVAAAMAFTLLIVPAQAQGHSWPTRPVKVIMATAAGSAPDVTARLVTDRLSQIWGQQVLIINRPGAGGLIAMQAMATAERDNHTLYFPSSSSLVVLPETNSNAPLDIDRDLIFSTPPDRMWEAAIRRLGADPAALQMSRGVH